MSEKHVVEVDGEWGTEERCDACQRGGYQRYAGRIPDHCTVCGGSGWKPRRPATTEEIQQARR